MSPSIPRPLVRTNQWFLVLSVVVSWATRIHWILAIPLAVGILSLSTGWNPVMRLGKLFLRKAPSEYPPEDRDQQRFNQWIATICLVLSLAGFLFNVAVVGYIFSAMVLLAAFVAILGFCIGCYIRFQWTMYRHRRAQAMNAR